MLKKKRQLTTLALALAFVMVFASVAGAVTVPDNVYYTTAEDQVVKANFGAAGDAYDLGNATMWNALKNGILNAVRSGKAVVVETSTKSINYLAAAMDGKTLDEAAQVATFDVAAPAPDKELTQEGELADPGQLPLAISSVAAVDGTITVNFNKNPEAAPEIADFVVKVAIDDAVATEVTPTNVANDAAVTTLTVPAVTKKAEVQSVVYSVSFKAGTAVPAPAFTVEAATGLAVASVSAINANAIGVTFNKAVEGTATFAVKRGTVTEDVAVTWNEAKTEATLTKSGNFTPAEYTVTVSGLEGLQNAENKVTFAAEEVKEIKILNAVLQQATPAQLNVEFINQYGKKATVAANSSDLTVTAYNKTKGAALALGADKLKVLVPSPANAVNDEVVITVIYKTISATATLKVAAPAGLAELAFGEIVLPTGQDKITPKLTKNVELKYTAKNSLGEEYKLVAGDITAGTLLLSSDNTIVNPTDVTVTSGKLEIAQFKKAGTVTLTLVIPASGATATKTITVAADAGVLDLIELEKTEASFAAGSTTDIKVGFTAKDNYGTVIAADKVAAADYLISNDNSDVVSGNIFGSGADAGKLLIALTGTATKGQSATVTVLVKATGNKTTIKVTAADAAVPTSIEQKGTVAVPTSLVVGGTTDIGFEIKDQYGAVLSAVGAGYTVDYVSSDKTVIDFDAGNTDKTTINGLKLRAEAKKAGTATIKAQLKKDAVVVGEKAYTIQVEANVAEGSTYAVTPVEPIYSALLSKDLVGEELGTATIATLTAPADKEKAVKSGYAEKLELKVTRGSSTSVVPVSALAAAPTVATTKNDGSGSATTGVLDVFEHNGSYYVYTSTAFIPADFATASGGVADVKGKVTFTINADDGMKVVTQELTVSKDELKAQSVEFKSVAPGAANPTNVATKSIDTVANLGSTGITGTYLWVKDQFGGYSLADTQTEAKAFLNLVKGTNSEVATPTITVGAGAANTLQTGVIKATATTLNAKENNATVRLYAQIGELTNAVTITVEKENIPPAAATTAPITVTQAAAGTYAAGDKITIKFSEPVDATKITVGNMTISGTPAHTLGTAPTVAPATGLADTFVITLDANLDVVATDTITIAAANVVDAAGNVAAAPVVFTLP